MRNRENEYDQCRCGARKHGRAENCRTCFDRARSERPTSARFNAHLPTPLPSDGCWEWQGNRGNFGFGRVFDTASRTMVFAHRVSWELANGRAIPVGLSVLHHCDTPACVRPEHLFLGTSADNMRDASQKGRLAAPKILTLAEAGAVLGVAASTLRHQTRNGKLDAFKVGRDWYVTPEEVERYRVEHRRAA